MTVQEQVWTPMLYTDSKKGNRSLKSFGYALKTITLLKIKVLKRFITAMPQKNHFWFHKEPFSQRIFKAGVFKLWVAVLRQGGSHKATWRQLNDTHTVPRAGRFTKINYELRYCSVRFSNRKGRDLKHALHVLKHGRHEL